jgi:tetratricopeptide (TPR) repeat protein
MNAELNQIVLSPLDETEKSIFTFIEKEDEDFSEISDLSKRGYLLLKENNIAEAIECFNKILAIEPDNNYALVGLGDAARKQGCYREGVDYYRHCLLNYPGNNYALFGLADCYKALNQYHKAIEIWEQYLLHDDKNITVLTRVADAYRKVRDFRRSKEVYLKVLEMEEYNAYAIIGLGHLHYDFKEYREALFFWGKMLELNKTGVDIRVLTSIGNCHRKLKTYSHGIPYFEQALERDPNNFYALFGLADCYRGMNQPGNSLVYWQRILEQDPNNMVILTRTGDAYRIMNDYENAEDYYRKALNIEFDAYAALGLAMVTKSQGKFDEAAESLRRLIQQDPRNYRFYIELADCYIKKNDKRRAVETLEEFQMQGIRNNLVTEALEKIRQ